MSLGPLTLLSGMGGWDEIKAKFDQSIHVIKGGNSGMTFAKFAFWKKTKMFNCILLNIVKKIY